MITPEDRQVIQEVVCLVESDLKRQEKQIERRLVFIELVLLVIAIGVTVFIPLYAAPTVFVPNVVLRGYQIWSNS